MSVTETLRGLKLGKNRALGIGTIVGILSAGWIYDDHVKQLIAEAPSVVGIMARLDQIDARLARIETALVGGRPIPAAADFSAVDAVTP